MKGRVVCPRCDYVSCRMCVQTYLLSVYKMPHCMNCRAPWSFDFLEGNLQKKYLKGEYRDHYENCLLANEKALLAEARPYALHKMELEKAWDRLQTAKVVLDALYLYSNDTTGIYRHRIRTQIKEVAEAQAARQLVLNKRVDGTQQSTVRFCTKVGCGGLVGSDWVCAQCQSSLCPDCHQVLDSGGGAHECSQDDLGTVQLLQRDTRPCPGCASSISKIDGCDQMFCVHCKTAFSWRKGTVIEGRIHNPHYYEYLRARDGRVPREAEGDLNEMLIPFVARSTAALRACEDILLNRPDIQQLYNVEPLRLPGRRVMPGRPMRRILRIYLRGLSRLVGVVLPRWQVATGDQNQNLDLRVLYLLDRIDEKSWKRTLRIREGVNRKRARVYNILEHFRVIFEENIRSVWSHESCEKIIESIDDITRMRQYANQQFCNISKAENLTMPYITNMFRVLTQNKYGIVQEWVPANGEILDFYV